MSTGLVAGHDGRRAVRLVLGAAVAAVAAAVLLGLLTAALARAADPGSGAAAVGFGLASTGAVLCTAGLLVVARAGALARRASGVPRAISLLRRCVLAASVATVVVLVVGVAAMSTSAALPAALGGVGAILLLTAVGGVAARARRQLPGDEVLDDELDDGSTTMSPLSRSPSPVPRRVRRNPIPGRAPDNVRPWQDERRLVAALARGRPRAGRSARDRDTAADPSVAGATRI